MSTDNGAGKNDPDENDRFWHALLRQMRHYSRFVAAWQELAERGQCDAMGGAEFKRVFKQWKEQGSPNNAHNFIRKRANMRADGSTPE